MNALVIALHHVTLIDGTGAEPTPDATVAFRDGRIIYAGTAKTWLPSLQEDILNMVFPGKFLLPGLIDCHIQLARAGEPHGRVDGDDGAVAMRILNNARRNLAAGITTHSRRRFFRNAALGAAAMITPRPVVYARATPSERNTSGFKLKYAPPFGMFEHHAGKDPLDQIKFMADQGFRAMFDNGLMNRPAAEQNAIAKETTRLGMEIGPFVAYADFAVKSFVTRDGSVRDMLAEKLKTAVETAERTNVKTTLVVPGRFDESLDWVYQTANVIENLKWCAGICEPGGLAVVIEPIAAVIFL